jgi:hypothetical protein
VRSLIGESTYRLVRDAVEVVPVESLTLKGKPAPEFRRSVAGPEDRLVTVLGDAGIGKSRLIEEFVRNLAGEAVVPRGGAA